MAFTLIELLVVIVIIGILSGLVMPSIKNLAHPNVMAAASRQLLDDLALARQRAITERANVYVVFFTRLSDYTGISPQDTTPPSGFFYTNQQANHLTAGQYSSYALYTRRGVGDQPGVNVPRYITEWKHLPAGSFIPESEFANSNIFNNARGGYVSSMLIPFPTTNLVRQLNLDLPWIGFDPQGRLLIAPPPAKAPQFPTDPVTLATRKADLRLRIALGSALQPTNSPNGTLQVVDSSILEMPAYTWPTNAPPGQPDPATRIAINWLTGRARIERAEVP